MANQGQEGAMRIQYDLQAGRGGADGLFAMARRILAGREEVAEAPAASVDMSGGIGRALRHATSAKSSARDTVERAAHAIAVVEGTLIATDAMDAALAEMQDVVSHALAAQDANARLLCAQRYTALIERIDIIAEGAQFGGVNLINLGRDNIELVSPVGGRPHHAISHIVLVSGDRGMALKIPRNGFREDQEIEACGQALTRARARLIKAADTFLSQVGCLAPLLSESSAAA
jgi:hypothetical protein